MALVSDAVCERLRSWGVARVYGFPGSGADALIEAFPRAGDDPEFVQARHPESAALMACGHAKLTGTAGCCLAPAGPSTLRLLTGLYDAQLDRQPVVALLGAAPRGPDGPHHPHPHPEHLLTTLPYRTPHGSPYCTTADHPDRLPGALDRAFGTALAHRTVAAVVLPTADTGRTALDEPYPSARTAPPGPGPHPADRTAGRLVPDGAAVLRAARVLDRGRRVAVLVGQGAADAAEQIVAVADLLGAGVARTAQARDVLPDDLPFVTGTTGTGGDHASQEMLRTCDTLLVVGARPAHTGAPHPDAPQPGAHSPHADRRRTGHPPRLVDITPDVTLADPTGPDDVTLVGDPRAALEALLPLLHRKESRAWRSAVEQSVRRQKRDLRFEARQHFGHLINPASIADQLSDRLPDDAVLIADAGTSSLLWARHLRLRSGMRTALSGTATMGTGVPYAVAARLAHPHRPVIAFVGDGSFQLNGMAELVTVTDHLDRLAGTPPLVLCVLNNRDMNQATWDRRTRTGRPGLAGTSSVPDAPYAAHARLLGLTGIRCLRPKEVGGAWDAALAADRPVLLEFVVDADTTPAAGPPGTPARARALRRLSRLLPGRR